MAEGLVSDLNALLSAKKPTLPCVIKDFHKYVGSPEKSQAIASNIRFVLDNFQPSSNLGRLLRIKLMNKFRAHDDVCELLKTGDSLDVNQALKCNWYFNDLPDPANFVDDFIPCLSLSTRQKVLNKYGSLLKNTEAAEVIYTAVKLRYGTRTAISVLPACSQNFIRNEFPNIKIILPPGIVLSLFKKDPSLFAEYIKYLPGDDRKRENLYEYRPVLIKLASKDLEAFLELCEELKKDSAIPPLTLGRRPTKKILKTRTTDEINNYFCDYWFDDKKFFFSRLSLDQMKKLFVSRLLPSNISDLLAGDTYYTLTNLEFIKPALRSDVIANSFKTKYGREMFVDDIVYNLDEEWIEYLPAETKIKWIERKFQNFIGNPRTQAYYIAHLPVERSMPILKQLIESQSNPDLRLDIALRMVDTLKMNQNHSGIKDLFAYFVRRYRNEVHTFRSWVLIYLKDCIGLLVRIDPNEWAPIIEFINIMKLNHEVFHKHDIERSIIEILGCRVQNSFMMNGDTEGCLKDYLDFATGVSKICSYEYLKLCENTPYRSFCLQWLLNVIRQMKWADDSSAKGYHARLFDHLVRFNGGNPESKIPCPDWLMDSVSAMVFDDETPFDIASMIRNTVKMADVELWRSVVKRTAFRFFSCETICEILKFEPSFVVDNIVKITEKLLASDLNHWSVFYKKIRLFEPFGIPSEIAKLCRVTLKLEDAEFYIGSDSSFALESSQPHAVGALAIILPPSAFLEIAQKFVPTSSKVEDYSAETQALHDIQKAVGKSFTDVPSAEEVLPVAQKFAVGDYLKFVSGSLISLCVRVPEKKILPILKSGMDCPVSLRKHYLKLLYKIAPTKERVSIFVDIFKTEKNVSLRLVLFQLLRKAFIDEPGDDTFRTLKSVMSQLTEEDKEAVKELYDVSEVEDDFVGQYLELIWELSGSKWASAAPEGKSHIVNMIDCEEIKLLSEDFCFELLSYELSKKLPNSCPSDYLCVYLLHAPSYEAQAARWTKVMASLQPLITSCWHEFKFASGHVFPVRHVVTEMVHSLCDAVETHDDCQIAHPVQLLENVKHTLTKLIAPSQFIRECLEIDVAIRVLQNERSLDKALTDSIIDLYKTYLESFSQYQPLPLLRYFVDCARDPIKSQLAVSLSSDANPLFQIVGVTLLSTCISWEKDIPMYKSIIETLSASENPAVQAAAGNFFSALESKII